MNHLVNKRCDHLQHIILFSNLISIKVKIRCNLHHSNFFLRRMIKQWFFVFFFFFCFLIRNLTDKIGAKGNNVSGY